MLQTPRPTAWIPALLVALLVVLGLLQYRWLGQVSAADGERRRTALEAAGERFAADFDRGLTRLFLYLSAPPEALHDGVDEALAQRYSRWRNDAEHPGLVGELLVVDGPPGEARVRRYDIATAGFVDAEMPAELKPLAGRLGRLDAGRPRWPFPGRRPTLAVPLFAAERPPEGRRPRRGRRHFRPALAVADLDRRVLAERILPELAARHFQSDVSLAVVDRTESGEVLYRRGEQPPEDGAADVELGLFRLLPPERLDRELGGLGASLPGWRAWQRFGSYAALAAGSAADGGRWRLLVTHPAGSLEAAVAVAHRRNLAVALGILALLAASAFLLLRSARRSQDLARQQLELVAGVTHELLTPLAALRSAGENLADGVVDDPQAVRRYGQLIDREGRRLSTMIGNALDMAGLLGGRRTFHPAEVAPATLVDEALEACRALLDEAGFRVERVVDEELPTVRVDRQALRGVLVDLITNAVKYGRDVDGAWLGIGAGRASQSGIEITVSDRGPGIPTAERAKLWEPFFRGRAASEGTVAGSGLGLALVRRVVEAHGGSVRVESATDGPRRGTVFTVELPAAEGSEG